MVPREKCLEAGNDRGLLVPTTVLCCRQQAARELHAPVGDVRRVALLSQSPG